MNTTISALHVTKHRGLSTERTLVFRVKRRPQYMPNPMPYSPPHTISMNASAPVVLAPKSSISRWRREGVVVCACGYMYATTVCVPGACLVRVGGREESCTCHREREGGTARVRSRRTCLAMAAIWGNTVDKNASMVLVCAVAGRGPGGSVA